MSNIDWSKAPEWANKYGLVGFRRAPVWFNHERYEYLHDGRSYRYSDGCTFSPHEIELIYERSQPWTGEGTPPVGAVCEAYDYERSLWWNGKVLMHGDDVHAFVSGTPECWGTLFWASKFRQIRTPDQIAAEERMSAIREMADTITKDTGRGPTDHEYDLAEYLYDAGYRKQVTE